MRGSVVALAGLVGALLFGVGGCDDNGIVVVPVTLTTGSGLFVVDCNAGKAYVPLLQSPDPVTGNGRIAIVDLSVDPNSADPRESVVVLSHQDNPTGTAIDLDSNIVIAVSGSSGQGGFVDLLDATTGALTADSPIPMPAGSEPGSTGQVLYDPVRKVAIISVDNNSACTGSCQGFITFDLNSRSFGPVIDSNYSETFAFNAATNLIVNASDDDHQGEIGIVDVAAGQTCTLFDNNIGSDSDGASVDFNTGITVISNEDGTATVVNLNGLTFQGTAPSCTAVAAGTDPNSVLITGLPSWVSGSAVNPGTHEAFLIEDGDNGIVLLTLPAAPVAQLTEAMITSTVSSIPSDPEGGHFSTQGDPYAVAMDVCNNRGFAIDSSSRWLVEIDLASMKADPGAISTVLPVGNCAGTTTQLACDNGNGARFFPLPPLNED